MLSMVGVGRLGGGEDSSGPGDLSPPLDRSWGRSWGGEEGATGEGDPGGGAPSGGDKEGGEVKRGGGKKPGKDFCELKKWRGEGRR